MPGMIDAHMHPRETSGDYQEKHLAQSSAYKTLRAAAFLQQLLLAGWTGIRVAGDGDIFYGDVDLKRSIEEGTIIGPHMAVASHYLSITGGGGDVNFSGQSGVWLKFTVGEVKPHRRKTSSKRWVNWAKKMGLSCPYS